MRNSSHVSSFHGNLVLCFLVFSFSVSPRKLGILKLARVVCYFIVVLAILKHPWTPAMTETAIVV